MAYIGTKHETGKYCMNYDEYLQRMLDAPSMKYSEYLQLMLDAALDIKAGNFNEGYGICGNIDHKVTDAMDVKFPGYVIDDDVEFIMNSWRILKRAFYTWPKFSGDIDFPINDPNGIELAHNVYDHLPKWTGEYGALRFELLDHVIDFLKKEV